MPDYGAKVSRRGFDVNTASDRQLLWSSAFQALKIVDRFNVNFTADGSEKVIYTHNLGYKPMFFIYGSGGAILWHKKRIATDTTAFKWFPNRIPTSLPINTDATARVLIFGTEFGEVFNAPNIDIGDTATAPYGDFGIKVSRDGFDVKTAALNDLVFSSGGTLAGQAVHQQIVHKYGLISNKRGQDVQTIAHGLGYAPMFSVFVRYRTLGGSAKNYWSMVMPQWTEPIADKYSDSWTDTNNIYFYDWTQGMNARVDYAWYILKDPF